MCSWFKAWIFVFFSLAWTGHFNFMKEQFEIDWGKIIFSLKTRDPNWPVNRRGAGLSLKELGPGAIRAKVSLGLTPSHGEMTKQGGPELLLLGGVWNRCAGSLFIPGWGWGAGPPRSQVGAVNTAVVSTQQKAKPLDCAVCKNEINPTDKKRQLCVGLSRIARANSLTARVLSVCSLFSKRCRKVRGAPPHTVLSFPHKDLMLFYFSFNQFIFILRAWLFCLDVCL